MTNRRFATPSLGPPKMTFGRPLWDELAVAGEMESFSGSECREIRWICKVYLDSAAAAQGGVDFTNLRGLNKQVLAGLTKALKPLRDGSHDDLNRLVLLRSYRSTIEDALRPDSGEDSSGLGLPDIVAQLERLERALGKAEVWLDNPAVLGAPTAGQSVKLFIQQLQGFYERKTGNDISARQDGVDLGKSSPFVRFVHLLWLSLPAHNRVHRSAEAMSKRVQEVRMPPEEKPRDLSENSPESS